jgi:hypothetical protein
LLLPPYSTSEAAVSYQGPLVLLILLVVGAMAPSGSNSVLPRTLRDDARQRGCAEIADFYDRPGRIDPAYVFGYLESKVDQFGEKTAVYWCQRPTGAERYLLVVWLSDSSLANTFTCPRTLAWRNYPGGLRVLHGERLALSEYWYRKDPKRRGPSDSVTDGPVIESEYDGVAARFFCHAGDWLVQQLH